jgi:hypothetical protein
LPDTLLYRKPPGIASDAYGISRNDTVNWQHVSDPNFTFYIMNIYLRYKNSPGDPWTVVPSLTSFFPSQPAGSLPVLHARTETAPETVSPCGCGEDSSVDDHYILRIGTTPIPQSAADDILLFLLRYKSAPHHEVKYAGYADGDYLTASLSLIVSKNENGMSEISFRLAAGIGDVI